MRNIEFTYDRSDRSTPLRQVDVSGFISRTYGWMFLGLLPAYDSQRIRGLAYQYAHGGVGNKEESHKGAVFSALSLYLNFSNLFLSLLRIFGNKRN
jgi:FtsH-binding integral membrane protein